MALKHVTRFRTTQTWKRRFRRVARAEGKDSSDLARQVLEDYLRRREAELQAKNTNGKELVAA